MGGRFERGGAVCLPPGLWKGGGVVAQLRLAVPSVSPGTTLPPSSFVFLWGR